MKQSSHFRPPKQDPSRQKKPSRGRSRRDFHVDVTVDESTLRWVVIGTLVVIALFTTLIGFRGLVPGVSNTARLSGSAPVDPIVSSARIAPISAAIRRDADLRKALAAELNRSSPWNQAKSCVAARQDNRPVAQLGNRNLVAPASVQKIFTGAVALRVLGADTKFTTSVMANAKPKDGVIEGPLFLIGGGDPMLSTNDYYQTFDHNTATTTSMNTLVDYIVAAGIKQVKGGIVGDDTYFDDKRDIAGWDPNNITGGQVGMLSGLMVNDGFPERAKGGRTRDPAANAAATLATLLREKGVKIDGEMVRGQAPGIGAKVAHIESASVSEIVSEMLAFSDNTTAEVLLKQIGRKARENPSTAGGLEAVHDVLTKRGVNMADSVLLDGSGLHHDNRTTCPTVVQVIQSDGPNGPLAKGFSRSGQYGTLQGRMGGNLAGRVVAKTGTLTDVSGLAGWAFPKDQPPFAFAMIENNIMYDKGRAMQDRLATDLATAPRP